MTGRAKVYGASDDLIEIRGDISEEFDGYNTDEQPGYLAFSDGTILRIQYGVNNEGCWRITRLCMPGGTDYAHTPGDEDGDEYSDVLTMTTPEPLVCVVYGRDCALLDGPVEPVGWTRITGGLGPVVYLEGDCPTQFHHYPGTFLHSYIALADGTVVECRCGDETKEIWRFSILHVPATSRCTHLPCPLGGDAATDVVEIRPAVPIGGAVCGDHIGIRGRH